MLESLTKFSDISEKIGQTISIVSSSIGFLGLECIILLLVSFVLLFFVNQINAIYPKVNYILVILISVIFSIVSGMSLIGLVKYISVMLFPIFLSIFVNQVARFIGEKLKINKKN